MTRPDATLDQLRTLIDLANAQHLHDAEQWLRERVEAAEERMGVRSALCKHGSTEPHNYRRPASALLNVCPGPKDGAR